MGGVYNTINAHLYHYAGNNPVKYTDPDGRISAAEILGKAKSAVINTGKSIGEGIKSTAQAVWQKATEFHFEGRDSKNVDLPTFSEVSSSRSEWIQLPSELSKYHDNETGSPELKFVHPDGREAVFTKDFSTDGSYQLYTDPKYKGTYNYVSPASIPEAPSSIKDVPKTLKQTGDFLLKGAGHLVTDVLPYKILGSKNERDQ
jgi:hypothetical protein